MLLLALASCTSSANHAPDAAASEESQRNHQSKWQPYEKNVSLQRSTIQESPQDNSRINDIYASQVSTCHANFSKDPANYMTCIRKADKNTNNLFPPQPPQ